MRGGFFHWVWRSGLQVPRSLYREPHVLNDLERSLLDQSLESGRALSDARVGENLLYQDLLIRSFASVLGNLLGGRGWQTYVGGQFVRSERSESPELIFIGTRYQDLGLEDIAGGLELLLQDRGPAFFSEWSRWMLSILYQIAWRHSEGLVSDALLGSLETYVGLGVRLSMSGSLQVRGKLRDSSIIGKVRER